MNYEKQEILLVLAVLLVTLAVSTAASAQVTTLSSRGAAASTSATVPRLVQFSGIAKDIDGKPLSGTVAVTFFFFCRNQLEQCPAMDKNPKRADQHKGHYYSL